VKQCACQPGGGQDRRFRADCARCKLGGETTAGSLGADELESNRAALAAALHRTTGMSNAVQQRPRTREFPTIRQYMTPTPHTIARSQSLSTARRLMREYDVRHLPVLEGGQIVGLLSERDLFLVETLPGVNPTDVRVEEAMVESVYTATPETPVAQVIETMIERKLGSAVIMENDKVAGVFTTVDALRALLEKLQEA
jgi:acetoin utilization protein AcuB